MEPTTSPPPHSPVPAHGPKVAQQSIWCLVLGILSFCLSIFGAIPAIILGVIGIKKANQDPANVGGKGLAIAGIVLGILGMLTSFAALIIFSITVPAMSKVQDRGKEIKGIHQVRMVGIACLAYASDHDGSFPETLDELFPDYIEDENLLGAKTRYDSIPEDYHYRSGLTDTSDPYEPFILSPIDYNGKSPVAFVSGIVKTVGGVELEEIRKKFE